MVVNRGDQWWLMVWPLEDHGMGNLYLWHLCMVDLVLGPAAKG